VGGGLVGQDVGDDPAALEGPQEVHDVGARADRDGLARVARGDGGRRSRRRGRRCAGRGSAREPLLDAGGVHVGAEEGRAGHHGGERLRPAHPAQAARDDEVPGQVAV